MCALAAAKAMVRVRVVILHVVSCIRQQVVARVPREAVDGRAHRQSVSNPHNASVSRLLVCNQLPHVAITARRDQMDCVVREHQPLKHLGKNQEKGKSHHQRTIAPVRERARRHVGDVDGVVLGGGRQQLPIVAEAQRPHLHRVRRGA